MYPPHAPPHVPHMHPPHAPHMYPPHAPHMYPHMHPTCTPQKHPPHVPPTCPPHKHPPHVSPHMPQSCAPVTLVFFVLSRPARSTRCSLDSSARSLAASLWRISRCTVNTQWLRLLAAFSTWPAVLRPCRQWRGGGGGIGGSGLRAGQAFLEVFLFHGRDGPMQAGITTILYCHSL